MISPPSMGRRSGGPFTPSPGPMRPPKGTCAEAYASGPRSPSRTPTGHVCPHDFWPTPRRLAAPRVRDRRAWRTAKPAPALPRSRAALEARTAVQYPAGPRGRRGLRPPGGTYPQSSNSPIDSALVPRGNGRAQLRQECRCCKTQCWTKQLEPRRQCTFCIMGQQVNGASELKPW